MSAPMPTCCTPSSAASSAASTTTPSARAACLSSGRAVAVDTSPSEQQRRSRARMSMAARGPPRASASRASGSPSSRSSRATASLGARLEPDDALALELEPFEPSARPIALGSAAIAVARSEPLEPRQAGAEERHARQLVALEVELDGADGACRSTERRSSRIERVARAGRSRARAPRRRRRALAARARRPSHEFRRRVLSARGRGRARRR